MSNHVLACHIDVLFKQRLQNNENIQSLGFPQSADTQNESVTGQF